MEGGGPRTGQPQPLLKIIDTVDSASDEHENEDVCCEEAVAMASSDEALSDDFIGESDFSDVEVHNKAAAKKEKHKRKGKRPGTVCAKRSTGFNDSDDDKDATQNRKRRRNEKGTVCAKRSNLEGPSASTGFSDSDDDKDATQNRKRRRNEKRSVGAKQCCVLDHIKVAEQKETSQRKEKIPEVVRSKESGLLASSDLEERIDTSDSPDSDHDEVAKQKGKPQPKDMEKKPIGGKAKLRDGVGGADDEEREVAKQHLAPLPDDYNWIGRLPHEKPMPLWKPSDENNPEQNKAYADRSLCSLFVEMSQKALQHLLVGTNKLGRELFPHSWPKLTLPNLLLFIAIVFHMDSEKRRNLSLYWSMKNGDDFVKASGISKRRFVKWYRALRPYDPDNFTPAEKRENKIYKVEEYLRLSQLQMQKMRKPTHQHLSLDEEMATFKGRCGLIQIIKNKPRGEGLKYYALCDPRTGYVYSTILHSATAIEFQKVWGRIVAFCYKLITGRPLGSGLASYIDQGFCVYTDRYYTTVHMNYAMTHRNTFFCGTLRREQRSSVPKEIMMGTRRDPMPEEVKQLKRGEVLRRFSNYGDTVAISWMDNTVVTFLTSIDEGTDDPQIANRMMKSSKGRWFRLGVTQPSVAKQFSSNMGGVDIHDQLTTSVKSHHRSRRWYLSAVLLQSFDWFAANSCIIYNDFHPTSAIVNCQVKENLANTLLQFVKSLEVNSGPMNSLGFTLDSFNPTGQEPTKYSDMETKRRRLCLEYPHYPQKFTGKGRECVGHMQRVTTNVFCMACGVFLCDSGCFGRFHELQEYLFNDTSLLRPIIRCNQRY